MFFDQCDSNNGVKFAGLLIIVSALIANTSLSAAEAVNRPQILIVGTAHFQNPGLDQINIQIENVMTPSRQEEIEEFTNALKKFSPTHIAVEFSKNTQAQVDEAYTNYVNGNTELRGIEQHQLGYRLGKILGHEKIFAIDWNGNPPGDIGDYDWVTFGQENGFGSQIANLSDPSNGPNVQDMTDQTITEWLIRINHPDILGELHKAYFDIASISNDEQQPGANWVGSWYGRNLKIFNNILGITEDADARILVIYGLGHIYLLNQFATESGYFEVANLNDILD